jgi:phosphatidylserine/phosphatidylglycerophosphate/cardiolipin synthase-like enzyme
LGLRPVARASLVLRDNLRQRQSIERAYRRALATARTQVVVASAYFLPSRRVLQALFSAARRGWGDIAQARHNALATGARMNISGTTQSKKARGKKNGE